MPSSILQVLIADYLISTESRSILLRSFSTLQKGESEWNGKASTHNDDEAICYACPRRSWRGNEETTHDSELWSESTNS
jgi:hypothetical protein